MSSTVSSSKLSSGQILGPRSVCLVGGCPDTPDTPPLESFLFMVRLPLVAILLAVFLLLVVPVTSSWEFLHKTKVVLLTLTDYESEKVINPHLLFSLLIT